MMRSMFAGVAGSRNHQSKMDIIGNNIANVNTIGYKTSRMTFQEAFAQTLKSGSSPTGGGAGGTNPAQVGLGNMIRSVDVVMTQGGLEGTGRLTDLAIDGEGFFVVSDGTGLKYLERRIVRRRRRGIPGQPGYRVQSDGMGCD